MKGTELLGVSAVGMVGIGCVVFNVGVVGAGTGLYSVVRVGIIFVCVVAKVRGILKSLFLLVNFSG